MFKARYVLRDATDGDNGEGGNGDGSGTPNVAEVLASVQTQLKETQTQMQGLVAENNRLQGMLQAVQQQPVAAAPVEEPKTYTRAQLKAAVEAEQITEDEMESIWTNQLTRQITKQVTQEVSGLLTQKQVDSQVDSELDEYKRLVPNSMNTGSQERRELEAEYNRLRAMGYPRGNMTELIASRIVFGTLDKVRLLAGKKKDPEHHQDGGGVGGEEEGKAAKGGDPIKSMDARTRAHYNRLIDNGVYKDWDSVRAELKFTKQKARA